MHITQSAGRVVSRALCLIATAGLQHVLELLSEMLPILFLGDGF